MAQPISTRACECCGAEIGTYRITLTFEIYREMLVEAPDAKTANIKAREAAAQYVSTPVPDGWKYGYMALYDEDGTQIHEQ